MAGSSCSRKVHETTFEGLLPLRGIPTYTLRIHVIHTHVLQPLALHWIQIYCTVLYCLPYCLVVSYMPPPQGILIINFFAYSSLLIDSLRKDEH